MSEVGCAMVVEKVMGEGGWESVIDVPKYFGKQYNKLTYEALAQLDKRRLRERVCGWYYTKNPVVITPLPTKSATAESELLIMLMVLICIVCDRYHNMCCQREHGYNGGVSRITSCCWYFTWMLHTKRRTQSVTTLPLFWHFRTQNTRILIITTVIAVLTG